MRGGEGRGGEGGGGRGEGGGGECKQYYLVREADPSAVFYLHFGACKVVSNYSLSRFLNMGGRGGAERTFGPSPPPPLSSTCAKYGPRRECSFIVLRRSYNLHLYVMSDLCGLFFSPVFSLFIENPPPPHTPSLVPSSFFAIPPLPPFTKKVEKANFNLLSS